MKREKVIAQLESELVAVKAALADKPVCCFDTVEEVNGLLRSASATGPMVDILGFEEPKIL